MSQILLLKNIFDWNHAAERDSDSVNMFYFSLVRKKKDFITDRQTCLAICFFVVFNKFPFFLNEWGLVLVNFRERYLILRKCSNELQH